MIFLRYAEDRVQDVKVGNKVRMTKEKRDFIIIMVQSIIGYGFVLSLDLPLRVHLNALGAGLIAGLVVYVWSGIRYRTTPDPFELEE